MLLSYQHFFYDFHAWLSCVVGHLSIVSSINSYRQMFQNLITDGCAVGAPCYALWRRKVQLLPRFALFLSVRTWGRKMECLCITAIKWQYKVLNHVCVFVMAVLDMGMLFQQTFWRWNKFNLLVTSVIWHKEDLNSFSADIRYSNTFWSVT
jgi:hypothetical protein